MLQNLTYALVITLVGMVLVFAALAVLWGLMELTVQGTNWYNKRHPEEEEEEEEEEAEGAPAVETQDFASETQNLASPHGATAAAAAAVAVAMALQEEEAPVADGSQPAYVGQPSAWKSVMRSAQLTQRATQFTRKSRGNAR